ncbi:MAG: dipicolinate synthase subunit B [Christensenellaceae bacterium]|jgi:dipicolinate synthase subunit B|nr:dipicolinate synthase subunit B [Christensenellaceae bacterium]
MEYILYLNKASTDKRVGEIAKLCKARGIKVGDSANLKPDKNKSILFVEPRAVMPADADKYAFVYGYNASQARNYVCLSNDDVFVKENNYLTALAMKEILGICDKKILIAGWGKLTTELEKVLTDADIHILNFNHHKVPQLRVKYGDKAYFEKVDFKQFPIVINTIPKQVMNATEFLKDTKIYELASPPYGIAGGETLGANYEILPGLPGKYYPDKAAIVALDAITRHLELLDTRPTIVLCVTGSSCCYLKLMPILHDLTEKFNVIPVLSQNANLPNRFTDIEIFRKDLAEICKHPVITTIAGAETLASNKKIVASVVLPSTGNTIAKLAGAVTDTCVTMAVKALLRNGKPCVMGISTNDGLMGNATNIGMLLNRKNYYFIPFGQDDYVNKPYSLVCDFSKTVETVTMALQGKQLQPILN